MRKLVNRLYSGLCLFTFVLLFGIRKVFQYL